MLRRLASLRTSSVKIRIRALHDGQSVKRSIHEALEKSCLPLSELCPVATYYFDGNGKSVRPHLLTHMASAINTHLGNELNEDLLAKQKQIVLISEMLHTASLMHDDVIDKANLRRNKPAVNVRFDQRRSIWAGIYVISVANQLTGQLRSNEVIELVSKLQHDLIIGELQQMGLQEEEGQLCIKGDLFDKYLEKTSLKTASLMALLCKAVAMLSVSQSRNSDLVALRNCSHRKMSPRTRLMPSDKKEVIDEAFQFGRNLGIAFQLIDDWLDFVSSPDELGKPAKAADLKLGLATAPVLFAAREFPQLEQLIRRHFCRPGDVDLALELVHRSQGLNRTILLAQRFTQAAVKAIQTWKYSEAKEELIHLADRLVIRAK